MARPGAESGECAPGTGQPPPDDQVSLSKGWKWAKALLGGFNLKVCHMTRATCRHNRRFAGGRDAPSTLTSA